MSIVVLTAKILDALATDGDINYEPYDLSKVKVFFGLPPVPLRGVSYVRAQYKAPRTRQVDCLTGGGTHLDNINNSGIVEVGLMAGSVSGGAVQVLDFVKQPMPIYIEDDTGEGTSTVVALSCRLSHISDYQRAAKPGLDVYTFTAVNMGIVHGMRIPTD